MEDELKQIHDKLKSNGLSIPQSMYSGFNIMTMEMIDNEAMLPEAMLPFHTNDGTIYITARGDLYMLKTPGLPFKGGRKLHVIPKLKVSNGFSWAKGTALAEELKDPSMPARARAVLAYCFLSKASEQGQPLELPKIDVIELAKAVEEIVRSNSYAQSKDWQYGTTSFLSSVRPRPDIRTSIRPPTTSKSPRVDNFAPTPASRSIRAETEDSEMKQADSETKDEKAREERTSRMIESGSAPADTSLKSLRDQVSESAGLKLRPAHILVHNFIENGKYLPCRFLVGYWDGDVDGEHKYGYLWALLKPCGPKREMRAPSMILLVSRPKDGQVVANFMWDERPENKDITYSRAFIDSRSWEHIYAHVKYYWLRIASANADVIDKHFVPVNGDFVTALTNALSQNETFAFRSRAEQIKYVRDERCKRRSAATISLSRLDQIIRQPLQNCPPPSPEEVTDPKRTAVGATSNTSKAHDTIEQPEDDTSDAGSDQAAKKSNAAPSLMRFRQKVERVLVNLRENFERDVWELREEYEKQVAKSKAALREYEELC